MTTSHLIRNDMLGANLPYITHARGSWLYAESGDRYLDGASGAVVTSIGHAHPLVVAAMSAQAAEVTFTHRGAFAGRSLDDLADRLCTFTGYDAAWFVNSGSEAVEAAVQFALQYHAEQGRPQRTWFLSPRLGYNGNTLGGLSLSGHARRTVARELAHGFNTLPAPYAFRDAAGRSEADYCAALLQEARTAFEREAHRLAGIVIEPVGGATAGATVPPAGFLPGLRELCDEFGALLIVDEVMTGLGRTGAPMAAETFGVHPDIAAVGKGLGAGYMPIAAVLVREHVVAAITSGSGRILGGHTYAGNPLAATTALAVLTVLEEEDVLERAAKSSLRLEELLTDLGSRHPLVADVRGTGMMWALELALPGTPPAEVGPTGLAQRFFDTALAEGVVVYPTTGGVNDAVLVCPPLNCSADELDFLEVGLDLALRRLAQVLDLSLPVP